MTVETKRALEQIQDETEADKVLAELAYDEYYEHIEDSVWFWFESEATGRIEL